MRASESGLVSTAWSRSSCTESPPGPAQRAHHHRLRLAQGAPAPGPGLSLSAALPGITPWPFSPNVLARHRAQHPWPRGLSQNIRECEEATLEDKPHRDPGSLVDWRGQISSLWLRSTWAALVACVPSLGLSSPSLEGQTVRVRGCPHAEDGL